MNKYWHLALALLACSALLLAGCTDDETVTPPSANSFVGSATCGTTDCHENIHAIWTESGHPYKLTKITGESPTDAFPAFAEFPNDAVAPPVGLDWSDISYTIGGFGWKMRWIDNQGYIVTSGAAPGDNVQYNFENDSWVTYHVDEEQGTKPYNCGACHTTGWIADEDWDTDNDLTDNQDGMPGMHGTFFAGGVHCEECHGMGADHIASGDAADMTVDRSVELCGRCHTRDAANHVATSGGYIKHHEQYDEWLHSPHSATGGPECNFCHDPHASVKFDGVALGEGLKPAATCTNCHSQGSDTNHVGAATCVDCHMSKAAKSAIALHLYSGDIRTHVLNINPAVDGDMFNEAGNLLAEDDDGQAAITLDFACYGCHVDEDGVGGGTASMKTMEELSARATGIHGTVTPPALEWSGSDTCMDCHRDHYDRWADSGHPYKLTKIDGVAPVGLFPPFSGWPNDQVAPPAGLDWSDISYTIGGFGWKMRWVDSQGYIVTSGAAPGDNVQYNFENDSWVTYHVDEEQGTKPYNCGACHTSGWVADEDWETDGTLDDNQDGLPGMHGTFEAGGVHCEECHGLGTQHVFAPALYEMEHNHESTECGRCHTRDAENRIAAKGGFIKHHEQFDEWLHSPHSKAGAPGCNTCHDPHSSVKYDDVAVGQGLLPAADCAGCHADAAANNAHPDFPSCVDCHMPKATKSAIAVHDYQGDIRTHVFAINPAAVGKTEGFFNEAGNLVLEDANGKAAMTLDFACYGCHKDENGVGGDLSTRTLEELSAMATGIHAAPPARVSSR